MDWARAKNILIVLLFALNLLLTGTIVNRAIGGGADRALYADVVRILGNRGVQLNCGFPKQIKSSELLIYGDGVRFVDNCAKALSNGDPSSPWAVTRDMEALRYSNASPSEGLPTTSMSALDAAVRQNLGARGIDLSAFATDYAAQGGDGGYLIQYVLDYKGKLVFDSNVNVTVNQYGGISEITLSYREIKSASLDKLMKVMPAYQVILKNYNKGGVTVESINIGFMGQNTDRDNPFVESEEGAVWRVRHGDGSERFFEAAYGDEIFLATL